MIFHPFSSRNWGPIFMKSFFFRLNWKWHGKNAVAGAASENLGFKDNMLTNSSPQTQKKYPKYSIGMSALKENDISMAHNTFLVRFASLVLFPVLLFFLFDESHISLFHSFRAPSLSRPLARCLIPNSKKYKSTQPASQPASSALSLFPFTWILNLLLTLFGF